MCARKNCIQGRYRVTVYYRMGTAHRRNTNKVQRVNECKRRFTRGGGQSRNFQSPKISNYRSWNTSGQVDPPVPTAYRSLSTKSLVGARHALGSRGVRCTRWRRRSPPVAQMSRVRQSHREWHLALVYSPGDHCSRAWSWHTAHRTQ
jgi:hypothetical protein